MSDAQTKRTCEAFVNWDPNNSKMTEGARKLREFLTSEGMSQRKFATVAGLHLARLNRMLNGKCEPTLREACAIRDRTIDVVEIDPADWLN